MLKQNIFRAQGSINRNISNFCSGRNGEKFQNSSIICGKHGMFVRQKSFSGQSNAPGHGAGKGGGAGGSVRESGGGLGEYGAAQEEHYFFNKQKEQLQELKKKLQNKTDDKPKKQN